MKHLQSSMFVDCGHYKLHLRRLLPLAPSQGVVLMLHGAIENGRIFYTHSGKGLAGFLADHGFTVYCVDFAGRGRSVPSIAQGFTQSQHQMICQDIPTLLQFLQQTHDTKLHIVAHSWGGVVLNACLSRFPTLAAQVKTLSYFGTKRRISVQGWRKRIMIDGVWLGLAPWLAKRFGYFPARALKLGADDEPAQHLADSGYWICSHDFVDPTDQFNYAVAAKQLHWPPSWFLAAQHDPVLGNAHDVQLFMQECGLGHARFSLLGKAQDFKQDYDHISMLTHPMARQDHFPQLLDFMLNSGRCA
jgi:pimeloyl-ACP methyl ester carboxylesterase